MLWYVLGAAVAAVVIFLAVIVLRAVQFRPKPELMPSAKEVTLEEEKIVKDMQEMIRCRTVSYNDASQIDEAEFEKFRKLLPELYPRIHEICEQTFLGVNGILYCWKGREAGDPVVLMSHYDVVPVEESQWEKPAFEGICEGGELWGRGTLDTKGTLCGILEAA